MTSPALFRPKAVGAGLVVNALTKYIGGHGNALAGSITDTGLFDWTRYPNIAENYKSQPPALWGIQQIRKKGLRDWGGTLAAGDAHPIAVGAETLALRMERTCANAQALARVPRRASQRARRLLPGLAVASAARARAQSLFRGFGGLFAFELADGIDCFDFLNRLDDRRLVVEPRRQPDARDPGRAHDLLGDGRRAPRGDGHRRLADPRSRSGIEDRDDLIADFAQALAARAIVAVAAASRKVALQSRAALGRPPSASNSR